MWKDDYTTYLAGYESPSDFGIGLRREALRRRMGGVPKVVQLVDGASALEKMGKDDFPQAIQIVDAFHAMEHLETLIEVFLAKSDTRRFAKRRRPPDPALHDDGAKLHPDMESPYPHPQCPSSMPIVPNNRADLRPQLNFFVRHPVSRRS